MAFLPQLPDDFYFDVAVGNKEDLARSAFGSNNPGLTANREEGVNNIRLETGTGGLYPFPTADTNIYISSSSASDTATVVLVGLDDTYTEVVRLATLTGQTPVQMSGDIFRVSQVGFVTPSKAIGNIYFSTDNTDITSGVPNTLTNVLAKIDSGNTAGFFSYFTVPVGEQIYLFDFTPSSSKAGDVNVNLKFRFDTLSDFSYSPEFQAFQDNSRFVEKLGIVLPEKTDISLTASSPTQGSKVLASFSTIRITVT